MRWPSPVRAGGTATGLTAPLRAWGAAVFAQLRARWHQSLQLRVVGTTLAVSALVVTVLGFFLMQQIASGLLANMETSAVSQVQTARAQALSQFNLTTRPHNSFEADAQMIAIAQNLEGQQTAGTPGSQYYVAVLANQHLPVKLYNGGWRYGVTLTSIPPALIARVQVAQSQGRVGLAYDRPTTITYSGSDQPAQPRQAGLAVGVPLGSYYQLYYLFPFTSTQVTLQLVQRTLIGGGLALVALLALIASLVTRWVVIPVRQAAAAAHRVSAGDLDERMRVEGTDDLAVLATSFNEMAASLQDKLGELQELSQVQRQFVSDVSHELRTPLTTIRMAADVLHAAGDRLDPVAARSAELLQGQVERFQELLTDLLEISRYDAKAATLDAEPIDICDLVRRAAADPQQLAERRGTRIELRLPAHPCVAEADRRRIERILRNLLVNAVEHGEGREAVVSVAADRDAVAVAVRDYGIGLRPGEEKLVFDRFWRADPARARSSGSTGLGLSIALEDARLHGGWLEAWSQYGRGAVFRLTLPRVAGATLEGSPLPLGPDEAELPPDVSALAARLPGVSRGSAVAAGLGRPRPDHDHGHGA
ncbi:MAG TPA: MtrAB system histidine kinase MtrB [Streptosporangiaceae bacterium]|nr:MtrAB system histidine kinase MtrB [Streptosporangiaceae bacterium]